MAGSGSGSDSSKSSCCVRPKYLILISLTVVVVIVCLGVGLGVSLSRTPTPPPPPPLDRGPCQPSDDRSGDWKDFRLPAYVWPVHYDLHLEPDLDRDTYGGTVEVHLELGRPTRHLWMHIRDTYVSAKPRLKKKLKDQQEVELDVKGCFEYRPNEYVVVEAELQLDATAPGEVYVLSLDFQGWLNGSVVGFYRVIYTEQGQTKKIAATDHEPTDARKSFPCFDEPNKKATYKISITHDAEYEALSNMPREGAPQLLPSGSVKTSFERSVSMSTYLVCFAVHQFTYEERTSASGIPLRIYAQPSQIHTAEYAAKTTKIIFDYFEEYFNMSYSISKLDMIAIPDFGTGAMENWGLITYRETNLLYDQLQSSSYNKQRVASVIAHELVHQWFGNIVTMDWWDDLWLNEGFASFFEYVGVERAEPDWSMRDIMLISDVLPVMVNDALLSSHPIIVNVSTPAEITSVFDAISYSKGASILRMLEDWMGKDQFKEGCRKYLKDYYFKNAKTSNFWASLANVVYVAEVSPVLRVQVVYVEEVSPVLRVQVVYVEEVSPVLRVQVVYVAEVSPVLRVQVVYVEEVSPVLRVQVVYVEEVSPVLRVQVVYVEEVSPVLRVQVVYVEEVSLVLRVQVVYVEEAADWKLQYGGMAIQSDAAEGSGEPKPPAEKLTDGPFHPDLSIAVSHDVSSALVCWSASESLKEQLKTLPRLLTGFSIIVGIGVPPMVKRKWSATLPFFRTRDLDLVGLKLILAQEMSRSSPWRSHLQPGTEVAITVRSSINALMGGCRVPDLDKGPLHSTSADFTIMFIAREKSGTEIVQPVIIPFSRRCQADVNDPEVTLSWKLLVGSAVLNCTPGSGGFTSASHGPRSCSLVGSLKVMLRWWLISSTGHTRLPLFFCPSSRLVKLNGSSECDEVSPRELPELRQGASLLLLCCPKLAFQGLQFLPQLTDLELPPVGSHYLTAHRSFCHPKPFCADGSYEGAHGLEFVVHIALHCCLHDLVNVHVQLKPLLVVGGRPLNPTPWRTFPGNFRATSCYDKLLFNSCFLFVQEFDPTDRTSFIDDVFALSRADIIDYGNAFNITQYLSKETEYIVWERLDSSTAYVQDMLSTNKPVYAKLQKLFGGQVKAIATQLGWDDVGTQTTRLLRETVLGLACQMGDTLALNEASHIFQDWIDGKLSHVAVNLRLLVYRYGMKNSGNATAWSVMFQRYMNTSLAQEKDKLLYGLASVENQDLLTQLLEATKDESVVRSQDLFTVVRYVSYNPVGRSLAWNWTTLNWNYLVERYTINDRNLGRLLNQITTSYNTESQLKMMEEFFSSTPDAGAGEMPRKQALETVRNNIQWVSRNQDEIRLWLDNNVSE
ncbi:glutamyl aminopeptidase [Sphaeramia orbicularis]|uniref:glutamyl aminopeptidase n=1 Tax=Sphaeramia orbicularis TaxID=375764 RepID=UPI00117F9906|nr:glutamyl aminopeptidase-like [Sphaeramia orbicularis]